MCVRICPIFEAHRCELKQYGLGSSVGFGFGMRHSAFVLAVEHCLQLAYLYANYSTKHVSDASAAYNVHACACELRR